MNKSIVGSMVFGLVVAMVSLPLNAQSTAEASPTGATVAKVETDGGVIMVSDGGEFATALPDQRVRAKARLMVSEESAATVVYNDGCKQKYEKPGVYEIPATCVLPVAVAGGSSRGWIIGGAILGGAALYAIIDSRGNDNRSPVSR